MRTVSISLALLVVGPLFAAEPAEPKGKANRLAKESSPYLLQHAHNPVDWYPWGEEAFAKAKKEGKLIFLSIGYSSCHWCHVMERESFASDDVAKILNEHFVCIKVDREERPDIDDVYMTALQVLGSNGGWPLSMFLTADGKPIVGGTYWPKDDRMINGEKVNGFKTILQTMIDLNKTKSKELQEQSNEIARATADLLDRAAKAVPLAELEASILKSAQDEFRERLDPEHGGIGRKGSEFVGTKFPMPTAIGFLFDQARKDSSRELRILVRLTLEKMALGGIYDQLGGGFHRYSTERTWTVPHFEKMLYDNAQLVELYALAHEAEPNPLYQRVIDETLAFVARELTAPQGGFYSALDADSNGKEGEFYVWTAEELERIIGNKDDLILFKAVYGANVNFEGKYQILRLARPLAEVAKDQQLTEEQLLAKLSPIKAKLMAERAKRERPFLDTKIMTNWNGQMIAGYAIAGRVLKNPKYVDQAKRAADFVLKNLRDKDGRLLHIYANGAAKLNAFQDDYAFLIHGLLALHDATNDARWLDEAKALNAMMVKWHGEERRGGLYFTSHDHEKLFARGKDHFDGAQPSANGIAARNFVRLYRKTGDKSYRDLAEATLNQFAGVMKTLPTNTPGLLLALGEYLDEKKSAAPMPWGDALVFARQGGGGLKRSDGVVKITAVAGPIENGQQKVTLTLTIDEPWHIYANPVKSKILKDVETTATFSVGGQKLTAQVEYPAGKLVEDDAVGNYMIYEGKQVITATLMRDPSMAGPIDIAVKLQACNDKVCLLPATVKVSVK